MTLVDGRSIRVRLRELKGVEKLTRFLKTRRRDDGVRRSKEELAGDGHARRRRVMPWSEGPGPPPGAAGFTP